MVIKGMFYGMGNRNKMYNFYPRYQMSNVKLQNEIRFIIYIHDIKYLLGSVA